MSATNDGREGNAEDCGESRSEKVGPPEPNHFVGCRSVLLRGSQKGVEDCRFNDGIENG